MKERKEIINGMCLTYRHDYGLRKDANDPPWTAGMTDQDAKMLYKTMEQIYDNEIAPYVEEYRRYVNGEAVQIPQTREQAALMMRVAQMYLNDNDKQDK